MSSQIKVYLYCILLLSLIINWIRAYQIINYLKIEQVTDYVNHHVFLPMPTICTKYITRDFCQWQLNIPGGYYHVALKSKGSGSKQLEEKSPNFPKAYGKKYEDCWRASTVTMTYPFNTSHLNHYINLYEHIYLWHVSTHRM